MAYKKLNLIINYIYNMPPHKFFSEFLKKDMKEKREFYGSLVVPRKTAPPKIKKWIEKNKNKNIKKILVCRKPIQGVVKKVLDIVSLGKFSKSLKGLHYEDIFHLYLYITIGGRTWRIEKNEVVTVVEDNRDQKEVCADIDLSVKDKVELKRQKRIQNLKKYKQLSKIPEREKNIRITARFNPKRNIKLKDFIKRGEGYQKEFWSYNPKGNNCQNFAQSLLVGNNLIKKGDRTDIFIKQDTEAIFRNNPKYLAKFSKTMTDIAGVFDLIKSGFR